MSQMLSYVSTDFFPNTFMDVDPVIALGSGDILGAFNTNSLGFTN
jgi:hypothetical protein